MRCPGGPSTICWPGMRRGGAPPRSPKPEGGESRPSARAGASPAHAAPASGGLRARRGRLGRARRAGGLRAAGPLAYWRRRAVADGVVLAGDAAAFMDPMTGQGVYLALRGGELAAEAAVRALDAGGPTARILAGYERERHRAFAEAFLLSRVLQYVAFRPRAASHALPRMAQRPDL